MFTGNATAVSVNFPIIVVFAQTNNNSTEEADRIRTALSSGGNEKIGTLTKTDQVKVYYKTDTILISIDYVSLKIIDGIIVDVQVKYLNHIFENKQAPIELNRLNQRKDNLTCNNMKNGNDYSLVINTILTYDCPEKFIVDDTTIVLTKNTSSIDLSKNVTLNHLINLRTFTDAGGLAGKSNALTQVEGDIRFTIRNRNIRNSPLFFFRYIRISGFLAKFDDKFGSTNADKTFSRINLLRRSNKNLECRLNIMDLQFKSLNRLGFDFLGGISSSDIKDTSGTNSYLLPYSGFNIYGIASLSKNFSANISYKLIRQWAEFAIQNTDNGPKYFFTFEGELAYNTSSQPGNKVFLRGRFIQQTGTILPFMQIQFGYNVSISDLINNNNK